MIRVGWLAMLSVFCHQASVVLSAREVSFGLTAQSDATGQYKRGVKESNAKVSHRFTIRSLAGCLICRATLN
jgi:hypothetical protein